MVDRAWVIRAVRDAMRPLAGRIKGMVRRATLGNLTVTGGRQAAQIKTTANDEDDSVELCEAYGFTSSPPSGAEGVVLRVGGQRAVSLAFLFGNREHRMEIEQGESAVYHMNGSRLHLQNNGTIEVANEAGATLTLNPDGSINVTPAPGQTVNLAGEAPAALAVARVTDPVAPSTAMASWGGVIESAINALAPGTFGPGNSFAGTVSADFGTIASGGQGSVST